MSDGIEINIYYELYCQCKLERDLLKQELQVTREQLEKAEKVIKLVASRRCSPMVDSAIDTYLYKQKDEVKGE